MQHFLYEVTCNSGKLFLSAKDEKHALDRAQAIIEENPVCENWHILSDSEPRVIDSLIRQEAMKPASWLMTYEGRTEAIGELREGVAA